MAENPVSIVIPTWNAAGFVERALECLVAQEEAQFEVLVVDNGVVNAETELVCERFRSRLPVLRYLRFEKQLGYAGAVNAGTRAAAYDLVAVTNNDNLPAPRWVAELVAEYARARAEGREAVVSSLVSRPDFPEPLAHRMNLWGRLVRAPRGPGPYVPFHPDGSAFLFSKAVFGEPYDEDYFIYHEDVALGWRAWLKGFEVRLAERSQAATFDGGSTRRIKYLTAWYTERNRWLNYLCFLSAGSLVRLLPLLLLDSLAKLAAGSNRKAKLMAWLWVARSLPLVLRKREAIQAQRARGDEAILPLLSGSYANGRPVLNGLCRLYARLTGLRLGSA